MCYFAVCVQGCQYRLEVFQTSNKGWGIRSWDTIPNGAFVMNYTGNSLINNNNAFQLMMS